MPLNFGGGGGGKPYIRYKASLNSWEKSADGGIEEFAWSAPAIFDIEAIELGWMMVAEGAFDWQPWPNNNPTPQPDESYKRGFSLNVFSKGLFGDEPVREFRTSASGCVEFIKELYNTCEREFGKGQVPVVNITGSRAVKIGKGTTRIPTFEVVKWIARPAELSTSAAVSAPPPSVAAPSPKPISAAPAPAAETADEF